MARRALQTRQMILVWPVMSLTICSSPKPISRNRVATSGAAQSRLTRTSTPALTRLNGHSTQSGSSTLVEAGSVATFILPEQCFPDSFAPTHFLPITHPILFLAQPAARLHRLFDFGKAKGQATKGQLFATEGENVSPVQVIISHEFTARSLEHFTGGLSGRWNVGGKIVVSGEIRRARPFFSQYAAVAVPHSRQRHRTSCGPDTRIAGRRSGQPRADHELRRGIVPSACRHRVFRSCLPDQNVSRNKRPESPGPAAPRVQNRNRRRGRGLVRCDSEASDESPSLSR